MIKEKYFYTVLFLDDYYPERDKSSTLSQNPQVQAPVLKKYQIMADTMTQSVWWDNGQLYVRHNLQLPITLEMWDQNGNTLFYCPILKQPGAIPVSIGQVVVSQTGRTFRLIFNDDVQPPTGFQTYTLAVKTLPTFDTKNDRYVDDVTKVSKALDQIIEENQTGLAIVFRRRTLDQLFDLICQFDESYWHSMAQGRDLKYLTRKSKFQTVKFSTKYTSQLQDIIDMIDTSIYETKFSWNQSNSEY